MPTSIDRQELQRLLTDESTQLVEVLPVDEYEDEHLPGAINIPLKELNAATARKPKRSQPVIVYCSDYQSDTSPRPAARLESIGFQHALDYVAGNAA